MKAKVLGLVLLAMMVGARAASAETIALMISDGTTTFTILDGGAGDASSTAGVITFNQAIGNFFVNVTTGIGSTILGPGEMDLNSVNVTSVGGGTLTMSFSQSGNTVPFPGWTMNFGGTFSQPFSSVTYSAYADAGNSLFGTSQAIGQLAFTTPGAFSGTDVGGVTVASPYSLTQILQITTTGSGVGSFSGNAELTPIPEPTSLLLLGGGLSTAAMLSRRGRSKRSKK